MKTRIGKIARLPKQIRDELNNRLADGVLGPELILWLNSLPEVQKVLTKLFAGRPISKQNLSEWRHGGYAEWAASRDGRAQWHDMLEHAEALNRKRTSQNGTDVTSYLGIFLIAELAEAMDQLHKIKDFDKRRKLMSTISRILSNLRMDDCREKRLLLWNCQEARRDRQVKARPSESNLKKNVF